MTLYEIISNFFAEYVFVENGHLANGTILTEPLFNGRVAVYEWLCDICTIGVLIWLVICCFLFVRWMFRLFAGLIKG